MRPQVQTTSEDLRRRLDLLYFELAAARGTELSWDSSYMLDLRAELDEVHAAWAMACVLEIAISRARETGPLVG